jgi:hypothetical protein
MADQLRDWHDFYILIGTAAATLVGLMFVAASVGATYFTEEQEIQARSFLTPTVVHFSVVLLSCLACMAPPLAGAPLGGVLAAGGAIGIGQSCRVALRLRRRGIMQRIDLADRSCYILIPMATYATLIATGVILPTRPALGLGMLAAVLVALLLLGIRNAWDMTVWIVLHTPNR